MNSWINRATKYMGSLVTDNGPSVTNWLALRTTEAMQMLVACMVITECVQCFRGKGTDAGMISAIVTIGLALITATSLNKNTKLALDAQKPGDPSKISTPGATITTGEQPGETK